MQENFEVDPHKEEVLPIKEVPRELPRLKLFGERAERIQRSELVPFAHEIISAAESEFSRLELTEQLDDKQSFGDIDIIAWRVERPERQTFEQIFGSRLEDYHRNGTIYDLLLRLSAKKSVQADFIWAKDQEDFERKLMYYSKGYSSAIFGILANKLGFKYGTDGFFKRFLDRRGNWHDILVSGDLNDGLRIMGLDPQKYREIRTAADVADFVISSPFFSTTLLELKNLPRRHREDMRRAPAQQYLYERMMTSGKERSIEDSGALLKEFFPEYYAAYLAETERIDAEAEHRKELNGDLVMSAFGLRPGPMVGKVLKYLSSNHPDIYKLTPEIVADVRDKVLSS